MHSERKILDVLAEEYAPALAAGLGLGDDHRALLLFHILPEVVELGGQHPGFGVEVVVVGEGLGHFDEIAGEVVFAGEVEHAGEVVDLLVGFHPGEGFGVHCVVGPHEVPLLAAAVLADFESQHVFDHSLDDGVPGVCVGAALPERFTNSCE